MSVHDSNPKCNPLTGPFAESLPANCPPQDAVESDERIAFRIVKSSTPIESDFYSHAKRDKLGMLGKRKKPKYVPDCNWASCSMADEKYVHVLKNTFSKSKYKKSFLAKIKLDRVTGVIKLSSNGHIDLWMYKSFDPLGAIINIESIDHG